MTNFTHPIFSNSLKVSRPINELCHTTEKCNHDIILLVILKDLS